MLRVLIAEPFDDQLLRGAVGFGDEIELAFEFERDAPEIIH
jgi:hypothetical protein